MAKPKLLTVDAAVVDGAVKRRSNAGLSPLATSAVLAGIASLALALGLLVYASDRPAGHAVLMPSFMVLGTGDLFGTIGLWLPSFVHPFALSLFTATLRDPGRGPAYRDCAAWWAVNVAFELAQHPFASASVATALAEMFGSAWPARLIANYLLHGTFDPGDLIAVSLGALTAAAVLFIVHRLEVRHGG